MNEYNVINTSQKKSDWNANEGEAGYIKNRTHYETVNETEVTHTFTIPDDYSSDEYEETNPEDDAIIQAIYNAYVADAEETGGNLVFISSGKIKINGTEHDCYLYLQKISSESVWGVSYLDKEVDVSSLEDVYAAEFFVVSENPEEGKGILYDVRHFNIGQNEISCPITQTTIKKIDPKYLPDMGGGGDWNASEGEEGYIANRTHYETVETKTASDTFTIPQDFEPEDDEFLFYENYEPDPEFCGILQELYDNELESGDLLASGKIIIDGTEHDCWFYYNDGSIWGINTANPDWDDNNWSSFCYCYINPFDNSYVGYSLHFFNKGEHEVEISFEGPQIHKIDAKYLPNGNIKDASSYGIIEGYNANEANGMYAHAEGFNTFANGHQSHAEGMNSHSENDASHAEGGSTTASGYASHAEGGNTTASGSQSHAEGGSTTASGYASHAEGGNTTASGEYSHAEGSNTTASTSYSHAEGKKTTASGGYAHAEGWDTTASGEISHAEGSGTKASGERSHAEGNGTKASGYASHAEGSSTTASGEDSHAEGNITTASGSHSHAEGGNTIANHRSQHVFGELNVADPSSAYASERGTYVEIVGNGTDANTRSNARTLDWSGNEWLAGKMTADLGIVLKSPDGSSYTLTMNNDGTLKITKNT